MTTMLAVALGLALSVAACGSSAATTGGAPATDSTAPSTTSTNAAVTPTTSAPTPGTPTKYEATYVTCDWSAKPAGASNANSFRLAVVEKKTPDQQGFSVSTNLPDSHPVAGLGDKATIYSGPGTFMEIQLIAEKGQFDIALAGQYGGNAPAQSTLETDLVALARKVFAAVGA